MQARPSNPAPRGAAPAEERQLSRGTLTAPATWEVSGAAALVRQPPQLEAPMFARGGQVRPPPYAQVTVLDDWLAAPLPLAEAMEAFLERLTARHPAIAIERKRALCFADGAEGLEAQVVLEPFPGLKTWQRHVLRVEGAVLHHLVGTVAGAQMAKLDGELDAILASYRPAAPR